MSTINIIFCVVQILSLKWQQNWCYWNITKYCQYIVIKEKAVIVTEHDNASMHDSVFITLHMLRWSCWQCAVGSTDRGACLAWRLLACRLSGHAEDRESEKRSSVPVVCPTFTLDRRRSAAQSLSDSKSQRGGLTLMLHHVAKWGQAEKWIKSTIGEFEQFRYLS